MTARRRHRRDRRTASSPSRTACSAPTPTNGGVVDPRVPPGRRGGLRAPGGRRAGRARAAPPRRRLRGHRPRRRAAAALRARGEVLRGRDVHAARPVRVPADARRDRPVPRRRGPPRGALREARRARARDRRRHGRRVRRLGAERAVGERRRRLQLLGRPAAPDALARLVRHLGAVRPRRRPRARATSTRSGRRTARCCCKRRPVRVRRRGPAADGVGRPSLAPRVAATSAWMEEERVDGPPLRKPVSVYEVHLGSWRRNTLEGNRSLTYRELADELADYVTELGFTHVELLPVMAHPFSGSWGYQVTSYFAPTPRLRLARRPARVRRPPAPARHRRDPRLGPGALPARRVGAGDASTARRSTSTTTRAAARTPTGARWSSTSAATRSATSCCRARCTGCREYHADGIRVDAVASMLYLDYSREEGEWVPNEFGGREDLEAVAFLKELNEVLHGREPGDHLRRRGVDGVAGRLAARPTSAGSASASSGTWAGCTTRSPTSSRTRSTAATTTTS